MVKAVNTMVKVIKVMVKVEAIKATKAIVEAPELIIHKILWQSSYTLCSRNELNILTEGS